MDDGSLIGDSRQGVFCTDSFSKEEVLLIQRYLQVAWKIETHIGSITRRDKEMFRLYIHSTETLKEFLRIILPFMQVEQMLPKAILLYKEPELQQRWTSEVAELTGFSKETVDKYLGIKRSKWKAFSSEDDIVRSF